jgi:hypothetical protein
LVSRGGGRLVADDDRRVAAQGPGDRDPLLLPARQIGRAVVQAVVEADRGQEASGLAVGVAVAGILHPDRDRDVLERGQGREQVEALEHEAERAGPDRR